ncbi:MAG: ABC transporter ATP-binding protein [Vicinamibacterales bacterium]|jgi:subfamily B ATP-binding cassette protein MsbA
MEARRLSIAGLLRPHARLLAVAAGAMLVQGFTELLEPWPLKVIFDYVLGDKAPPAWMAPWLSGGDRLVILDVAAMAVVLIAVVNAVSAYTDKYFSSTVGKRVGFELRHRLYHHVQRLSLSFYERRQTGDMVVRLTSDIDAAEDFIAAILQIALDLITITGMTVVMFYLDWRFSLIGLSVAPVLFVMVYRYTRRIKNAAREVKAKESALASVVQESISSARVVKAFATEDYEERRLDRESAESVRISLRARSLKARLAPLVDVIVAVGTCVVLWYGVRLVIADRLSAGALLVFVIYLGKMYKPMKNLSKMSDTLSKAAISFERIREVLSLESQVRDRPGAKPAPPLRGRIEFAGVTFGFSPDQSVLTGVNLTVAAGQRAALVGLTGTGKSTLLCLIPRLYDVRDGRITIDGDDIRDYKLETLRRQVSFVLQDTLLFRATVAQNIAYGRPDATTDEIVGAARLAHADEFIDRLPQGYETMLGERGDTLSGGQRQRIAIARAIIRDAPILLLDEPSASLDPESEQLIFEGLSTLMAGRTSITIAHRLATVRHADVIFVLDHGVIAEQGTHRELLAKGGLYARLYRIQFQPEDPDRPLAVPEAAAVPGTAGAA